MWSFFSKEAFSYEIGEKDVTFVGHSVFNLHKGVRKATGQAVSIFTYNVKGGNQNTLNNARNNIKKLKTLKHPSILTYIDSYEDENVIHLVTEPVVPLLTYINELKTHSKYEEYVAEYHLWGLKSVADAVLFLHEHEQRHNNIFHGAVFVDKSGSWKLGELGYISSYNAPEYPVKVLEMLNIYSPPQLKTGPWSADFWGLGVLMWEVFNEELSNPKLLSNSMAIPEKLKPNFQELISLKVKKQEAIPRLIKSCSEDNSLVITLDGLHNYHLKDKVIKAKIFEDLQMIVLNVPEDLLLHKIFELIKQAYEFETENSARFVPICILIVRLISDPEFQKHVEQFIVKLFSSNDRATRLALLKDVQFVVARASKSSIDEIFSYVRTGFLDTNPTIRGETIKALVQFAPKLSRKHLNDDTLRTLFQVLTKDPEDVIRTNTTICLGKIAQFLMPESRKKILISAFLHALKDPCPTVRIAGIQALAVTNNYYTMEMLAKNVLPGLCCLTIDVDRTVRENTFKTIRVIIHKLENVSASPELKEDFEKDVMNQPPENCSSNYWNFTALTTKFLKTLDIRATSTNTVNSGNTESEKDNSHNDHGAASLSKTNYEKYEKIKTTTKYESEQKFKQESVEKNDIKPDDFANKLSKSDVSHNDIDSDDASDWENDGWGIEPEGEAWEQPEQTDLDQVQETKKTVKKLGTRLNK